MEISETNVNSAHVPFTANKNNYSRTAMADIMQMQTKTLDMKTAKMMHEYSVKEKELQLKEKELSLKARELDLKEKELELRSREIVIEEKRQMKANTAMHDQELQMGIPVQQTAANEKPTANAACAETAFDAERMIKQEFMDDLREPVGNRINRDQTDFYSKLGDIMKQLPEQCQPSIRQKVLVYASELCVKSNQSNVTV